MLKLVRVGVFVVTIVSVTLLMAGCARSEVDLAHYGHSIPQLDNFEEVTDSVCTSEVECIQAARNSYVTLLKFETIEKAQDYAIARGYDAYDIVNFVADFTGNNVSVKDVEIVRGTLVSDVQPSD